MPVKRTLVDGRRTVEQTERTIFIIIIIVFDRITESNVSNVMDTMNCFQIVRPVWAALCGMHSKNRNRNSQLESKWLIYGRWELGMSGRLSVSVCLVMEFF